MENAKKLYKETNNKLWREIENANQLATKVQNAEAQIQRYAVQLQQMNQEVQRLTIINNELHTKIDSSDDNVNRNGATSMEMDQVSSTVAQTTRQLVNFSVVWKVDWQPSIKV